MTLNQHSCDTTETRRRRARFRAWHRGTRELDLILGRFADARVASLADDELDAFEALLEVPDVELYNWIVGRDVVAEGFDTPVFREIAAFRGLAAIDAGGRDTRK